MTSADNDCYLCGAPNEADASHCVRCSGQLLKLPSAEPDDVEEAADPLGDLSELDDLREPEVAEQPKIEKVRRREGNIADQRLSDALGLDSTFDVAEDNEGSLVDTVVTSIPRAMPSADIPLIGTRAGAVPQSALGEWKIGKVTPVLLGLLALVTAWLAYDTVIKEPEGPENIAFTATTTTSSTSTTTTEAGRRQWQMSDVAASYSQVFAHIELYDCSTPATTTLLTSVFGVALDNHNVLVDNAPLAASADAALIRSRAGTGAGRQAILTRTPDGALVATSRTAWSRNLGTDELSEGLDTDETFFIGFDTETKEVGTDTSLQGLPIEITVSATGDPNSINLSNTVYSVAALTAVDTRVEVNPDAVEDSAATGACVAHDTWREVGTTTNTNPTIEDTDAPESSE